MADREFPSDCYEDSGCRLPLPKRDELAPATQKAFDRYAEPGGGSIAGLWGPGGIKLHSPHVSEYTREIGRYLRHEAGYSAPIRELAILVTAREMDSQFEWAAHEPEALKEGLDAAVIDIVKHRKPADGLAETERTVIEFGRQLFGERRVAPELFARALEIFGQGTLVDLVCLMANYSGTASLLAAFDMQLQPGSEPLLPIP